MGSVFRRKRQDARATGWYVEFSHGGKRIRRLAKGAETKTEAKAYLREIERQIDRGDFAPKKKKEVLLKVWAERYLEWSKLNKRSWKRDAASLKQLIPFFKGKLLKEISPFMIEDYKKMRRSKVSGSTVNRELSCLKHMLNLAIDEGLLLVNPVRKVRFFPEQNTIDRILSPEEKEKLLAHSNGLIRAAIVIGLNTGMRRGEILCLQWSQIDFERGFIKVLKTKSGKSRFIPINSLVFITLKKLQEQKTHDVFVFWNERTRKPIQDIKKGYKKACQDAGIENLRFHDLRHNFASNLVENGVDIVTVSELLGHSDINLTAKRYSHPSPHHKKKAVEGLIDKNSSQVLPELLTEGHSLVTN
ncbi:tyrosine-type recombinase/integrase [Acidobacteriota bacterium]